MRYPFKTTAVVFLPYRVYSRDQFFKTRRQINRDNRKQRQGAEAQSAWVRARQGERS